MEDNQSVTPPAPAPEPAQVQKTRSGWGRFILETLQTIVMAIALYLLIDSIVARVRVENISMQPTLRAGEFILVNKLSYRLGDYQRGDIIVFHYPPHPEEDYIKRIIGLAGDEVAISQGKVSINGSVLTEQYIAASPQYNGSWRVPEGSLFVLGDNRNQSSDSHSWGFVPVQNVVGKALVIYWPLDKLKVLNQPFIVNAATKP